MTAKELIDKLKDMPQEGKVMIWDQSRDCYRPIAHADRLSVRSRSSWNEKEWYVEAGREDPLGEPIIYLY